MTSIPIFPLNTVLYPEGILPLRIFEPRYLDMVSECFKQESGFGVCLIEKGGEIGEPAEVFKIGTLARIVDWDQGNDGLLTITAEGQQRFRIIRTCVRENNLIVAEVEMIDHQDDVDLPVEYQLFSDLLRQIVEKFELPYAKEHEKFNDPYWVGCRLAELLPVELEQRQSLLEIDDPIIRLTQLQSVIDKIDIEQNSKD